MFSSANFDYEQTEEKCDIAIGHIPWRKTGKILKLRGKYCSKINLFCFSGVELIFVLADCICALLDL